MSQEKKRQKALVKKWLLVNYKVVFYAFKNKGMVNEYNTSHLKHTKAFFNLFFQVKILIFGICYLMSTRNHPWNNNSEFLVLLQNFF